MTGNIPSIPRETECEKDDISVDLKLVPPSEIIKEPHGWQLAPPLRTPSYSVGSEEVLSLPEPELGLVLVLGIKLVSAGR
jgi:hypothetical protein